MMPLWQRTQASLLVPKRYFKEEGEVECHDMRLHDVLFQIVGGQWVGKTPPQPKPTHLLTARTPVHEDGGRDHYAPVVAAEKVVICGKANVCLRCICAWMTFTLRDLSQREHVGESVSSAEGCPR